MSDRFRAQRSEVTAIGCKHVGECYCVSVRVIAAVVDVGACNTAQAYIKFLSRKKKQVRKEAIICWCTL